LKRLEFCFAREFISFPFARTAATRIRSKGVGLVMGAVLKFAVAQTELYLRFLVILLQTLANWSRLLDYSIAATSRKQKQYVQLTVQKVL